VFFVGCKNASAFHLLVLAVLLSLSIFFVGLRWRLSNLRLVFSGNLAIPGWEAETLPMLHGGFTRVEMLLLNTLNDLKS